MVKTNSFDSGTVGKIYDSYVTFARYYWILLFVCTNALHYRAELKGLYSTLMAWL